MKPLRTALWALTLAAPAAAQIDAPHPSLSLLAGATTYDLSGTGSAFAAGLFVDVPFAGFLRAEAGTGFMRYDPQGGGTSSLLFPEVGLRAVGSVGNVQPFIGVGGGIAATVAGAGSTKATLHGMLGVRFLAGPGLSLRGELRVRSVDPFVGTTADFMGGLTVGL